jgi:hypothetical protein
MSWLTIFTAPKPFTHPHISIIQRNAIQSWLHLDPEVEVILIGEEAGLGEAASEMGVRHLPQVARNSQGTPLVSSIFTLARDNSTSPLLAYVNADIMLLPDFVSRSHQIADQLSQFLVVGQRWDLDIRQVLKFNSGWEGRLQEDVHQRGRLHPPAGSDYFIFPRSCFSQMPPFAIGRAGWDNWMFLHARQQNWPVIDATGSLVVVHQDHDYSHLPGGQPHYRLPETAENTRLAGGRRAIFTLLDADYELIDGMILRIPRKGIKLLREIETYPLVRWHSHPLAELTFAIFHPVKAWGEWRGRVQYKLGTTLRKEREGEKKAS